MLSIQFFIKKEITLLRRYIFLFVAVINVFSLSAQEDISKQLNEILISKDIKACKQIMQQITDADISQMEDSTLLDYYYLAAWNASENNLMEEKAYYLLKVKSLCENKLGIHNHVLVYFEVLRTLGETYEDLGKDDEALLWYEEGLVKGIGYSQTTNETLNEYILEIRDNAASILEEKGYTEMANYLKSPQPLNYVGSFDYACDLLSQALKLNKDEKSREAIDLLDEANEIFKRCGTDGELMQQPLYREYLMCYAGKGDIKQIDRLLRSKKNIMFQNGGQSYLVDDMGEVVASFLTIHHDVRTAQKYYQYIVDEHNKSNLNEVSAVEQLGQNLNFFVRIYAQIDSLENVRLSHIDKDYEWGVASLLLANKLITLQRYDDANVICKDIYKKSSQLKEDPQNLHWFVLMNLADYYNLKKDLPDAEKYLNEQLAWLDLHNFAENTEERGWVYNKLGIAYMNGANYEAANKMLLKAEKILLSIYKKESVVYETILHNRGRLAQLQGKLDEAKELLTEALRIQKTVEGKTNDRTTQYLNEVEQAIKVRL